MTEHEPMAERIHRDGDAAAYALGALEPHEAETFERHLETCTICREELQVYAQVVDALPAAVPQHKAPKGVRRRVLGEVRADVRSRASRTRREPLRNGFGLALRGGLAPTLAVVTLLVVGLGGVLALTGRSGSGHVIAASVNSPAEVQLRVTGNRGELIVRHMRPPSTGHIYEVWLQHANRSPSPTSALFSVTSAGSADVGVPGDLRGVSTVMVTQERAGGSRVPTQPPVIVAHLS